MVTIAYSLHNFIYSLDIVDPALLVRRGLPAEGQAAPAPVPGWVGREPARAAGHVAETEITLDEPPRMWLPYAESDGWVGFTNRKM